MTIIINGTTYNNISWNDNGFSMQTDMTLSEIEQAFAPGQNTDIIVEDGSQEIARYYNKGLDSVTVSGSDPRTVEVKFNLTQIAQNAESEIRESMEYSDEAIEELADLFAAFAASDIPVLYEEIKNYFTTRVREENGIFHQFDLRIRALENKADVTLIETIEQNDEPEEE